MIQKIKDEFNRLINLPKNNDTHIKIIELLKPVLCDKSDNIDDKIWAYWNISDRYALLRMHEETYINHLEFESYLNTLKNDNYKLMLICDTTQSLSLSVGGHYDYYKKLFNQLTKDIGIDDNNYIIYFECLRTALYPKVFIKDESIRSIALTLLEKIINKYNDDSQILRFKLYYYNVKLNEQYNLG